MDSDIPNLELLHLLQPLQEHARSQGDQVVPIYVLNEPANCLD